MMQQQMPIMSSEDKLILRTLQLYSNGLMSRQTAIEKLADVLGIEDAEKEFNRVREEQQEAANLAR